MIKSPTFISEEFKGAGHQYSLQKLQKDQMYCYIIMDPLKRGLQFANNSGAPLKQKNLSYDLFKRHV